MTLAQGEVGVGLCGLSRARQALWSELSVLCELGSKMQGRGFLSSALEPMGHSQKSSGISTSFLSAGWGDLVFSNASPEPCPLDSSPSSGFLL